LARVIFMLGGMLALCSLLCGGLSFAAADGPRLEESSGKIEPKAVPVEAAALVFNNRKVLEMRGNLLGYPPAERAKRGEQRIADALEQDGAGEVTTKPTAEGVAILVNGMQVFLVTPGDVNPLAGETLGSTADAAVRSLSKAVEEARDGRDVKQLVLGLAKSLAATAVFALLLWALVHADRWLEARISASVQARIERSKVAGLTAVGAGQSLLFVHRSITLIVWLIGLFGLHLWLTFVLVQFPYTRPWGEELGSFLLATIGSMGHAVVGAMPGLVTVVIIFIITRFLARLARAFFDQFSKRRTSWGWLDADTAGPTQRIFAALLWLFAFAMAYPYLPGSHTEAFRGLSVLVGLMISIGASNLVGQAASGFILIYSRTLKPGEYVKIAETQGTVTEIGMFTTRVDTGMGEDVVLPNSFVLSNTTRNYSRATDGEGYVLDATVTIGYGTPWRQVHAMLQDAARRTPGVLQNPAPYVIQTALSDFYVEYRLVTCVAATAPTERARATGDLHANVQDAFNERGVQILSPHYMIEPREPQVVPKANWYAAPARKPPDEDSPAASGADRIGDRK
jgi:small-conductance mechanosensitive channel